MNIFQKDFLFWDNLTVMFLMTVLFVLFGGNLLHAQDFSFNPAMRTKGNDTNVQSISAKYAEGRVYLKFIIRGMKDERYYVVKRSVDGNYFETIGGIKCLAIPTPMDMMYSFTDNYPEYSFIYYKIVHYTNSDDSLYSETTGVLAGTDKSNLYVTIGNDIWVINQKNEKMIPLKLDINTKGIECNPSLSPDGKTIYFVSDRKGGLGGKDIWVTEMISNGQWSEPYNLGNEVNSAADEEYPLILDDGVTLFFSRKKQNKEENFDVVFSTQDDNGFWSIPENINVLKNETKDYFSVISKSMQGKAYTYTVKKESAEKNTEGIPSQKNK